MIQAPALRRLSFAVCALAPAGVALAQASPALPETPGLPGGAIVQMLLGLAAIIILLFAVSYVLRRMNGAAGLSGRGPLRIVGGLMISARERIVLIEVEDTWIVVGIVPGQIKTLHTLPKGELPAHAAGDHRFGHWLRQFSERRDADR